MKRLVCLLFVMSMSLQAREYVARDLRNVNDNGVMVSLDYAQEMLDEINKIREWYNCEKLVLYNRLECAAVFHSRDIGEHHICSGRGTDGSTMDSRADRCATVAYGQFVACGHRDALSVVHDWTKNYENRKFILDPRLKKIGVGMYNNYWTVLFSY